MLLDIAAGSKAESQSLTERIGAKVCSLLRTGDFLNQRFFRHNPSHANTGNKSFGEGS
ncbi:MAG: hypothetical protein DDT30_02191 [Dehalococcoidia bacterium]|nr:hypothetical protein [Bacillota bacterium]MBT9144160.1 hypothetical protein [Bacillota bacterium]